MEAAEAIGEERDDLEETVSREADPPSASGNKAMTPSEIYEKDSLAYSGTLAAGASLGGTSVNFGFSANKSFF